MSLLMQALKKAEHAKEKELQESPEPADSPSNFPTIEAPASVPQTPDRIEPELQATSLTLDQPATEQAKATPQLPPDSHSEFGTTLTLENLPPKTEPQPTVPLQPSYSQPAPTAQKVMAASPRPGSNRKRLFGVGGVLITALALAAIYFYWQNNQLQPAALRPSVPLVAPSAAPKLPPVLPAPVTAADVKSPAINPVEPPVPAENGTRFMQHRAVQPLEKNKFAPPDTSTSTSTTPGDQIQVQRNHAASLVNANLSKAYQLFLSGDSQGARSLYETVLQEEHNNRDALLGLAAIALRQHQNDPAAALYSRLLDLDPGDPDAIAGLTSLGKGDPDGSESQLKKVLAHNQQFGPALFELGNVYAQQSRWAEAQDAYFRAFASAPGNAGYAFNLAISLDRLGQSTLALDYYQKAVALSNAAPGSFSPEAARLRAAQLQQTLNKQPPSQ